MDTVDILIVDDSSLMRNLLSKMILSVLKNVTVDVANDGKIALDKIKDNKKFDLIILDLNMPVMNGPEFMKEHKARNIDIPVVIFSSIAHSGAFWTMECLELGAVDFLLKPGGIQTDDNAKMDEKIVRFIRTYGANHARANGKRISFFHEKPLSTINTPSGGGLVAVASDKKIPDPVKPIREPGKINLIAIGISTGGPNALREVFAQISPDIPQPIVVVQHMPVGFTSEFAHSLNHICPLEVKEATEGDILKKGRVIIAPGDKHIVIEKKPLASIIHLSDAPPRNGHRPSVDVLFESVAKEYQNTALGIIMTGMGRDGAEELAKMRKEGARTLGQDEKSSIVYGMPRVAYEMGAVQEQVPLSQMAEKIGKLCL